MKNFIENLHPAIKVIGIFIALFILWNIFGMLTDKNNQGVLRKELLRAPMMDNATSSYAAPEMKMMLNESAGGNDGIDNFDMDSSVMPEKKVIKNGNLELKIDITEEAAEEITKIAKNKNGEVFSTNFYERVKGQKSGTITIKVPVDKFEETMAELKLVANQVLSESTTGQDVTEQYSDLQAQLKNKRAEEQSFVKILDQASEIDDVLAITKQISRVRGEIERLEGQIKFMDSQTEMSVIVISLSEDVEITPTQNNWRPWEVTKKAFSDLLNNIQDFFDSIIRFIIVGIPSMIPFLLFVWLTYWIIKKIIEKVQK